MQELVKKTKAHGIYWNARFEPECFKLQKKAQETLEKMGLEVHVFNGNHLFDPREIHAKTGKPYTIFTPFYKAALKELEISSKPHLPKKLKSPPHLPSDPLPFAQEKWMHKLEHYWKPGSKEALQHLHQFARSPVKKYAKNRDYPAVDGTSTLSPYLHFGEICPQEIWLATQRAEAFHRQLIWREFATYFIYHFPDAEKQNWNHRMDKFLWNKSRAALKKWKEGKTGYPIVDAGMRQLWETGWMHNRVRMIVASFLIKDLLIHWMEGEKWFWDTLVDADKGNNVLGWQWVAGSGPDAAPYFRIFNPVLQGEKFDPHGEYIRRYVPELKNLDEKWIHHPWDAPSDVLEKTGIKLGKTYPKPIVDHQSARQEALRRFHKVN